MKTVKILLILFTVFAFGITNAQTKKTPAKKGAAKTQTKTETKPVQAKATEQSTVQERSESQAPAAESKKSESPAKTTSKLKKGELISGANPFKVAAGIKVLWGISATGKYFFKEHQAIEALVRYRGFRGLGNSIGISALYEYEKQIPGVEGLHWIAGAGLYFQHWNYKYDYIGFNSPGVSSSSFGASALIGLEYKFKDLPIAVSGDWMPSIDFRGGDFGAENGGIGIKYTF